VRISRARGRLLRTRAQREWQRAGKRTGGSTVWSALLMTTFSEITELNRGQKVSEIDPLREERYQRCQFGIRLTQRTS
jgi:hypothetical protein